LELVISRFWAKYGPKITPTKGKPGCP